MRIFYSWCFSSQYRFARLTRQTPGNHRSISSWSGGKKDPVRDSSVIPSALHPGFFSAGKIPPHVRQAG